MARPTAVFRSTLATIGEPVRAAATGTATAAGRIAAGSGGLALSTAGRLAGPAVEMLTGREPGELMEQASGAARAAAWQAGEAAVTVTGQAGEAAGGAAGHAGEALQQVLAQIPGSDDEPASALGGAIGHYRSRRAWSHGGRGYIEVRGLARAQGRRLATDVARALRKAAGVRWADVNVRSGQVLIAFDEDRVNLGDLLETVQAVEEEHGTDGQQFRQDGGSHPLDEAQLNAAVACLISDCLALAIAAGGKLLPLRPLPRGIRVAVALIDSQPALRRELRRRVGTVGADLVLTVSNAVAHGLTQNPSHLGIDALQRVLLVAEERAAKDVWKRREPALSDSGMPGQLAQQQAQRQRARAGHRPRPLPDGPVEEYAAQAAKGSLLSAAGVLAATRSPGGAADTLMAAVPRAARHGREAFAALLDREMARRGVVPLDGNAYRKLDRVSAVAVDARTLRSPGTGPAGPGNDLDPLAEHVLSAARAGGSRVLLTGHDRAGELTRYADGTLPAGVPLAEHVRRLQQDGHGVLVLTADDSQALEEADVAVAVTGPGRPACWAADMVCGPGLEQAWHLLLAVGAARDASKRSVQLALGGSALGALLALTEGRQRSPVLNLAPVQVASLMAMISSVVAVRRLAAREHPPPMPRAPWHAMTAEEAFTRARSAAAQEPPTPATAASTGSTGRGVLAGAASALASSPLAGPARGAGQLAAAAGRELRDPLTPVLMFGAAASAIVGSGVDAALVAAVMTGSTLVSTVERVRAERALRGLTLGEDIRARRLRWPPPGPGRQADGGAVPGAPDLDRCGHEAVLASELRPGDLIAIRANDVVPADARLLHTRGLEMDESSLTGESLPVAKAAEPAPAADLAERTSMAYDGTTVLAGEAYAVVVAAGAATESGRAVAMAGRPTAPGGVQSQLNELTGVALPVTGVSGALVGALATLRGVPLRNAVASGVAVAVAAVPEGLSLVATVAQLAAARRLSRRGVLVRSPRTLGTMGRADTVCFDKTGTLTEGRLRLSRLRDMDGEVGADTGRGRRLLTAAWRACPPADGGGDRKLAHATDVAIAEAGRDSLGDDRGWRPSSVLPFETSRGYSAAFGAADGRPYLSAKGTPEEIVARCGWVADGSRALPLTRQRRRDALRAAQRLAGAGLRVLAVADKRPEPGEADGPGEPSGLTLAGFAGIADSPRRQAMTAVDRLTGSGVRVAMITGDHPDTARTIAADLGIPGADRVLTGPELDRLSEDERIARVSESAVFARATPEHKVRIVQALQRVGRVVAVTGDGVNDTAAIRLADVGIAVTGSRTRAARNAADMIAQATDLESIADAMLEGQTLWRSVANAVSILVGGNAGEVGFTLYGTAVAGRAPLGTRQLLLINILTDMLPALAVALAPPNGPSSRANRPVHDGLRTTLLPEITVRGAATALGAIFAWHAGRVTGRAQRASTMSLASLVLTQLAQTLQTSWRSPAVLATGTVSALVLAAVIQVPGVSQFFGCTPLGPVAWAQVAGSAAAGAATAVILPRLSTAFRVGESPARK